MTEKTVFLSECNPLLPIVNASFKRTEGRDQLVTMLDMCTVVQRRLNNHESGRNLSACAFEDLLNTLPLLYSVPAEVLCRIDGYVGMNLARLYKNFPFDLANKHESVSDEYQSLLQAELDLVRTELERQLAEMSEEVA